MTRLDRFVVLLLVTAVIGLFVVQRRPLVYDPGAGRRPVPAPVAPTPKLAPQPPASVEGRVRRPLPGASPGDPLFNVTVEPFRPGMVSAGTAFSIGSGLWLTARHVANRGCRQIVLLVDGVRTLAEIVFLHPNADLAVLRTSRRAAPALPLSAAPLTEGETGYAFGFPGGNLGGTEDSLMGRARMHLGGRLEGTAAVLTWAEIRRDPDTLEALGGISGGPMFDENGYIVGIFVASSVRRGRNHTVAPEMLRDIPSEASLFPGRTMPAGEVAAHPVSLLATAAALSRDSRIAKAICIPAS
jgi:serine protease Do